MNDFCVVSQDLGHFSKRLHGFPILFCAPENVCTFIECKYTDRSGMGQKVVSRRQGMANERQNQDVSQVAGKQQRH